MHSKLTLRLDQAVIGRAKRSAHRRGKSVSQMVEHFFARLDGPAQTEPTVPPIVHSLRGCLKKGRRDRSHYFRYLEEKFH